MNNVQQLIIVIIICPTNISQEDHKLHPDCTPLGLIEKSLSTKEVSEIG